MSLPGQKELRLPVAPRAATVEKLFAMFRTPLIPVEAVRQEWFPYLGEEQFARVLETHRLPIPVTTLEDGNRALQLFEIHHLAAHIDNRQAQADAALAIKLAPKEEREP